MSGNGRTRGTILIVDDDADLREILADLLAGSGYGVTLAADGRAALDVLARGPRPDLIILDLAMPVMDGWELRAELLRDADLARIPLVVLSASQDRPAPQAAARLPKPVDAGVLLTTVARCVAARS